MPNQPISMSDLANQIRDLKIQNTAQTALIAALLKGSEIDEEMVHGLLETIIDPENDIIGNDQMARAMHFAQTTLKLSRGR